LPERVFALFDEYAAAYARGERPRAEEYLARAGQGASELAGLLDGFVSRMAVSPAAPSEVASFELWMEPRSVLTQWREARGLTRERVVDALIERLGLDRAKRDKVRRYYKELEGGVLDAGRVSRRVWEALAALLGAPLEVLGGPLQADFMPRTAAAAPSVSVKLSLPSPAGALRRVEPEPEDEIDRLFKGG
jgi:hypothetical protein